MLKFKDIKEHCNSRLLKETLTYGLGNAFLSLTPIVITPFLTRAFSVAEYGAIDLIYTTVLIIATFASLGLDTALMRFYFDEEARKEELAAFIFMACLASGIIFTGLTFVFFKVFKGFLFSSAKELDAFFTGLLAVPFIVCLNNQLVLLRAQRRAHLFVFISTVNLILTPALTILFEQYLRLGLKSYFIALLISQFISVILALSTLKRSISFKALSGLDKRKVFVFSLPLLIPLVLGAYLGGINKYFLQFYHGLSSVAIFGIGLKITMIIGFFGMSFRQAWFSYAFSKIGSADAEEKYKSAFSGFITVLFLVAFLVIIFAKPVILVISSREYLDARQILPYVCLGTIIVNLSGSFFNLGLHIKKRTGYSLAAYIIGFLVNITAAYLFVPRYSVIGAGISLLLGHISIAMLLLYFSNRLYPVKYNLKLLGIYAVLLLMLGKIWA